MNRFVFPVAIFAVLVVFLAIGLTRDPSYVPSPLIGKTIPAFSLPNLADASLTVSDEDLRGRYSVLNVWATWCVGCRQEHPVLNQIAQQGEVPLYGLNWKDEDRLARGWLEQLGNPYVATAVDREGRVAIDWGVYGAPETFLISPNGIVLHRHIGPLTPEIWQTEFLDRIAEARRGSG